MTDLEKADKIHDLTTFDYGDDAGQGFKNQTAEDYKLPFIALLQTGSPQVTGSKGKGIDGAEAGMFFNTATQEIYPKGFEFVPATTMHHYVEWSPRNMGGGFVGTHEASSPIVIKAKSAAQKFGQYNTPSGNDLVQTFYIHGVVAHKDGRMEPMVMSFSSTKIDTYKAFMGKARGHQINGINPPLYANRARVSSFADSNTFGDFSNLKVEFAVNDSPPDSLINPDDPRYIAAKAVEQSITAGQAKVEYSSQRGGEESPF